MPTPLSDAGEFIAAGRVTPRAPHEFCFRPYYIGKMKRKRSTNRRASKAATTKDASQPESGRQIPFGHYAVAFVDVLNQKDKLREISALPKNEEQRVRFIHLLQDTFGVINEYRGMFSKFFDAPPARATSEGTRRAAGRGGDFERLMRCEVKRQLFSDSMIYYVSLMETPERLNITSVHTLLSACAATFLTGLARRMICRIGIDVGIASEYFSGEIYGPALYRAYHLESERAQFPRIVVGDEFCNYVVSEMNWPGQSIDEQHKRMWAQDCADWIMTDVDGAQILDYAGEVTKKLFPGLRAAVGPAMQFASEERKRFGEQGDTKLAERYARLCDYLTGRVEQVWK